MKLKVATPYGGDQTSRRTKSHALWCRIEGQEREDLEAKEKAKKKQYEKGNGRRRFLLQLTNRNPAISKTSRTEIMGDKMEKGAQGRISKARLHGSWKVAKCYELKLTHPNFVDAEV